MGIRERPHRLPGYAYRGRVVAVFTLCAYAKGPALASERIAEALAAMLAAAARKNGCRVLAYCFMPDHVHLVLQGLDDESDLRKTVADFKQATGFWFARNEKNVRWQKDFYDRIVRSPHHVAAEVRYVLENPVRKGMVADYQDYPFHGSIGIDLEEVLSSIITW
jgi:putative transposase